MGYSDVEVSESPDTGLTYITARGGSRRERGAAIAAYVRTIPGMIRIRVHYSETYGFQTATYARYRRKTTR